MRPWSRLDRYVSNELRGPFALGLSGFTFVLLLNFLFKLARETIEKNVPLKLLLGYVIARLPDILVYTVPMAGLLSVLVALGRLSSQGELLAIRASGVSLPRVYRPVFVVSVLLMVLALGVSHYLDPMGRSHERGLNAEIIRTRDLSKEIDPGVFYSDLPGAVLYAERAADSAEGRVFEGVLLYREVRGQEYSDLIVARRGQGEFDGETGQIVLRLDDVEWHVYDPTKPDSYTRIQTPHQTLTFPPSGIFRARTNEDGAGSFRPKNIVGPALHVRAAELSGKLAEAKAEAEELARTTGRDDPLRGRILALEAQRRKAWMELSSRWAYPVSVPILMFAAFPLAARVRRGGRFTGLVQSLGVVLVFWLFFSFGEGLSDSGQLPPWLGAWFGPLSILIWGSVLWFALLKDSRQGVSIFSVLFSWISGVWVTARLRRNKNSVQQHLAQVDRWGGLTRLDSYLSSSLLRMLLTSIAALVILFSAVSFREALQKADPGLGTFPWADALSFVALSIPGQLQFLLPVAALFAVMACLSGLARSGEVVAMKASGIGPPRIALPLLVVVCLFCGLYAFAQETILPAAERRAEEALDRVSGRTTTRNRDTGRRWLVGEAGHFWTYSGWDGNTGELQLPEVLVVDLAGGRVLERITATSAGWESDGESWSFSGGQRRRFFSGLAPLVQPVDEPTDEFAETPETFGVARGMRMIKYHLADQMTFKELWAHIQKLTRSGYNAAPLIVGLHQKVVNPLLPALLSLLAIPLVVSGHSRKSSFSGFGIGLIIAFVFYALLAVTLSYGRQGVLSPVVAAWIAPVVLVISSTFALARAK